MLQKGLHGTSLLRPEVFKRNLDLAHREALAQRHEWSHDCCSVLETKLGILLRKAR